MLDKPRIRAFAEFARRYGVEELEKCLLRNKEKGVVYHYEGQLVGDYDKCQTEEEIIEMIKTGKWHADKREAKIKWWIGFQIGEKMKIQLSDNLIKHYLQNVSTS